MTPKEASVSTATDATVDTVPSPPAAIRICPSAAARSAVFRMPGPSTTIICVARPARVKASAIFARDSSVEAADPLFTITAKIGRDIWQSLLHCGGHLLPEPGHRFDPAIGTQRKDVRALSARRPIGARGGPFGQHRPLAVVRVPLPLQAHAGHEVLRRGDVRH